MMVRKYSLGMIKFEFMGMLQFWANQLMTNLLMARHGIVSAVDDRGKVLRQFNTNQSTLMGKYCAYLRLFS